jgi:hypothetical protein
MDLVGALGRAEEATRRIDMTRDQTVDALLPLVKVMQDDFACAARYVAPYEKSQATDIRASAAGVAKALLALRDSLDGQAAWLRYMDTEGRAGREPDAARSEALLSAAVERKDAAAQEVAVACIEAIRVVVERKDGEPTGRLLLTGAEREKLRAALSKRFGDAVKGGLSTEKDFATNAASAWWEVLSRGLEH